jgi:pilus assembly protein CpaF
VSLIAQPAVSFETIMPFLRPIEPLLLDLDVTEIMVNGSGRIFAEIGGELERVAGVAISEQNLQVAVRNLARALGDEISEAQPILDARLRDGSRVAAVLPPISLGGTTLVIRKFQSRLFTMDELVRIETLPAVAAETIRAAVGARHNILISGGTGTGKTTLLNALVGWLPPAHRIVLIEDTAELQLKAENLARFEARRAQPGLPAVTVRDLVRTSLRLRPDRLLIGEVRGGEAFDLLQALNTGHAGTLSTIHANSGQQALRRLASCVLESGVELPYAAIRRSIADGIQLVIHLERRDGRRVVTELLRVGRYDAPTDRYEVERCGEPTSSADSSVVSTKEPRKTAIADAFEKHPEDGHSRVLGEIPCQKLIRPAQPK